MGRCFDICETRKRLKFPGILKIGSVKLACPNKWRVGGLVCVSSDTPNSPTDKAGIQLKT